VPGQLGEQVRLNDEEGEVLGSEQAPHRDAESGPLPMACRTNV